MFFLYIRDDVEYNSEAIFFILCLSDVFILFYFILFPFFSFFSSSLELPDLFGETFFSTILIQSPEHISQNRIVSSDVTDVVISTSQVVVLYY